MKLFEIEQFKEIAYELQGSAAPRAKTHLLTDLAASATLLS